MKNPYEVLGLTAEASEQELQERYESLRAEYSEGRFQTGEKGAEAARKLTELENAWKEIKDKKVIDTEAEVIDYAYVNSLIKDGKYDEAQSILDAIHDRGGEWHYYQSIVYYKRDWLTESKVQLEEAIKCDPDNEKYKKALEKMKQVIGNQSAKAENLGRDGAGDNVHQGDAYSQGANDMLTNCCYAYCCANMCADFFRCCVC